MGGERAGGDLLPGYFSRTAEGDFEPWRPISEPAESDWNDPNPRFIDLDGDGHGDLPITEQQAFVWYRSKAKGGCDAAERVTVPTDERRGPALVFADGTQSIQLAGVAPAETGHLRPLG